MASNFDFLSHHYPEFYKHATHAESLVYTAPRASCFYTRFTLEQAVLWLYANDAYLQPPDDNSLGALIHEQTFKDNLKPELFPKLRTIHKFGNIAVHQSTPIKEKDAQYLIKELFHFLYWLRRFYSPDGKNLPKIKFNPQLIPQAKADKAQLSQQQLQTLETQLSQTEEMRRIAETRQQQTEQELATLKAEIKALKQQNAVIPDTHDYNEADTRQYLIDVLLKEAGWNINQPEWTEYPVEGMPNNSGKGKVDYVLWGDNGKPLALIEAKGTRKSAKTGKHQAKLYADCLEQKFQQRPVIFYTNGYDYWIWDDLIYPPRAIESFLKKDELEKIIFRRSSRKKLHLVKINLDIVGRTYQQEAIGRITETFENKGRKALLVMATGTGKTRTAIALVDLLKRANWVNRVLFLADRNALVTQALRAFKAHLPTVTAVDLTKKRNDPETANVLLSTYPTMFNRINRTNAHQRVFGAGYFDLVIVDEAHRSIYQKYSALFTYFDALLVGLTATPRQEINRDTYRIFDLESGVPSFAYELDDAIKDGYLVPPQGVKVPFKFLRAGIKYTELSPEEQQEYEERFRDEESGEIPEQVNAKALNQWLFNLNTVDQALELLMQQGLKVEGGDKLGKTIIFARNTKHADFIVERFNINYPHYKGTFAQVIHSDIAYHQSLIDDFSIAKKQPTIAVSVDMLDTGIDIPEIVNLVFFKPVYSRVKFNQMIGRGTRLCKNLFAVETDKKEFLIFDLCSNFEFFSQEVPQTNTKPPQTLTTQLVKTRLELSNLLQHHSRENPEATQLQQTLLDELHQHVATMEPNNFLVRRHLQKVEEFSKRERWNQLSDVDIKNIATSLAPLPNGLTPENELAKRFDLLCFKVQLAIIKQSTDFIQLRDQIRDLMHRLEEQQTVPMVKAKLSLIAEIQAETWWTDITPVMIDHIRRQLRDLIKFIDQKAQKLVYTNFIDELGAVETVNVPVQQTGFSPYQYRKKVEAYIRENENHIAIAKLKRNLPLTDGDLASLEAMLFESEVIESREKFQEVYSKDLSLKRFIRELVGLDRNAAKQAFAQYLENTSFSANQIRFVETIIDYLTQQGIMDAGLLYEPPFTDLHHEGLDGVFDDDHAEEIINIIESFNKTIGVNFGAASRSRQESDQFSSQLLC
ncbi:MAG: DEAD/DEAH box helicase family protein [Symploca sp. SIO3C6]|nr:DEAD/DEAH box helicase family protein [Symploca sp. SIO3C6]